MMRQPRNEPYIFTLLVFIVLLWVTSDYPKSWNDQSRIASIEALVDFHQFNIENTRFGKETGDKVYIKGKYYSDKPILLSVLAAPVYLILKKLFHKTIQQDINIIYYCLTLIVIGIPFALSVFLFSRMLLAYRLTRLIRILLLVTFAFGTMSFSYATVFNNHLFAGALLFFSFYQVWRDRKRRLVNPWQSCRSGLFLGLALAVDHGTLFFYFCFLIYLYADCLFRKHFKLVLFASLVPMGIYCYCNYIISGSLMPFATNQQYFQFPGSYFSDFNLTGTSIKHTFSQFMVYARYSLWGENRGLLYNAPLLIFPVYQLFWILFKKERRSYPLLWLIGIPTICTIFYYLLYSNNFGGGCFGVRWHVIFLPLLIAFMLPLFEKGLSKGVWFIFLLLLGYSIYRTVSGCAHPLVLYTPHQV